MRFFTKELQFKEEKFAINFDLLFLSYMLGMEQKKLQEFIMENIEQLSKAVTLTIINDENK